MLETPRSRCQVFEDVQLGPLLGQGGYGKVYRGLWNKTPVAVKVWDVFVKQFGVTKMWYNVCRRMWSGKYGLVGTVREVCHLEKN